MHGLQAQSHLVKTELAKVFREVSSPLQDDVDEIATLHELKENPEAILEVIDVLAPDHLIAIKERDQSALVNDVLPLGHGLWICKLEGEELLVLVALDLKDGTVASFSNLSNNLVHLCRVLLFDFDRLAKQVLNFRRGPEALYHFL